VDQEHLKELSDNKENKRYLPGVKLPEALQISYSAEEAIEEADIVLFSAPSQHFRSALEGALPYLKPEMVLVNVAKGIEQKSLKRLSEIAFEKLPHARYVSCPASHAEEVGRLMPTTLCCFRRTGACGIRPGCIYVGPS
jgi:glycerol-3-phosphate dehydrogenase (NAD(P)+)